MKNTIKSLVAAAILISGVTSCKNQSKEEKSLMGM